MTSGPAISADNLYLYHVVSGQSTIYRSVLEGGIRPFLPEVFVRLNDNEGYPDGITLDRAGCLWVALWDGSGVRRYDSDGKLMLHIRFPCARITKVAFGGADLMTAFVTTARIGLAA